MSSSSSSTGLNRSRSLRQPTAGLGKVQRQDEDRKDGSRVAAKRLEPRSKGAAASISAPAEPRNTSPSRLPKLGASAIATRTRAGAAVAGSSLPSPTATATGARSRPNSGLFGLGRSNTVAACKPSGAEAEEPSKPARPGTNAIRLTRPKSTIAMSNLAPITSSRPSPTSSAPYTSTASTAKLQSPRSTTHARAKSSATSLTSATVLRPQSPSARSVASSATKTTTTVGVNRRPPGRPNMPVTRASQPRPAPANPSVNMSNMSNTSAPSGASSLTTSTTGTRPSKVATTENAPRLRPTFNTLQQHYSPARNLAPKPLTASYLAPPTPSKLPANVALSSETARLQTELLQLHILHCEADAVTASWHASARERLGRRFAELAQADAEVGKEEMAAEEARNVAALEAWGGHEAGKGLEDKIQALDEVLSGLWSLGEPSGRHARAVRMFEKWVEQMTTAVEARRRSGGLGALMESGEVAFVGELDPAWQDEVSYLVRKLDGWQRQVAQLEVGLAEEEADEGQQRPSLARILAGCHSQARDMLEELYTMRNIERDTIAQEAAWIKRMNREETADDAPRAGAIWRAY